MDVTVDEPEEDVLFCFFIDAGPVWDGADRFLDNDEVVVGFAMRPGIRWVLQEIGRAHV